MVVIILSIIAIAVITLNISLFLLYDISYCLYYNRVSEKSEIANRIKTILEDSVVEELKVNIIFCQSSFFSYIYLYY